MEEMIFHLNLMAIIGGIVSAVVSSSLLIFMGKGIYDEIKKQKEV